MIMESLNELKATVQGIRVSTESQSYRAAATVSAPSTLFTKTRRVVYTTTLYASGIYEVAKAKLDALLSNDAVTDISIDLVDEESLIYNVTATEKQEGAWSAWR